MMRTLTTHATRDPPCGAHPTPAAKPCAADGLPLERLPIFGIEHVIGGQLCCPVKTLGHGAAGVAAGLDSFWHWRGRHGALA